MDNNSKKAWQIDIVEFVEYWTKKELPVNESEHIDWVKKNFEEALYNYTVETNVNELEQFFTTFKQMYGPR
jgi:predicted metalloenzyme YecM